MSKQSGIKRNYAETLHKWFASPLGQAVLEVEQDLCFRLELKSFTELGLILSCADGWQLPINPTTKIIHAKIPSLLPPPEGHLVDPFMLPFADECFDFIFVPHILEGLTDIKGVLAELYRIMKPQGMLIILHFNRFSSWGLCHLGLRFSKRAPWCGQFYSQLYLKSLSYEIGFEYLSHRSSFMRPPLACEKLISLTRCVENMRVPLWPPAVTLFQAYKSVSTMNLVGFNEQILKDKHAKMSCR